MPQGMVINGQVVLKKETLPVMNPAEGLEFDTVPRGDRNDVSSAIENAHSAHEKLYAMPLHLRAKLLTKVAELIRLRAEELAPLLTRETGKLLRDSRYELIRSAFIFDQAAIESRRVLEGFFEPLEAYEFPAGNENRVAFSVREPLGVVAAIIPFNFPAAAFAHKVAPALAVANSVVLKPSILAPITVAKLAGVISEAGFPPGSVNVITGKSSEIGNVLVNHELVNLITFTGSSNVGLELASRAIKNGKRAIMELGGSDPLIVLEDANLEVAAKTAVKARFDYGGQFCNSVKRIIVREEIANRFVSRFSELVRGLRVGDPNDPEIDIGPVISEDVIRELDRAVGDAVAKGGKLLVGGNRIKKAGYYYPPTVIDEAPTSSIPLTTEIFAPLAPIVRVKSDEEAVNTANSMEYGLNAAVFSTNFPRSYKLARKVKAGTVLINDSTRLRWDSLPFGGVKKSGIGREGMRDTMLEMTEGKMIEVNVG
jgi:succinyl-CoA reductase